MSERFEISQRITTRGGVRYEATDKTTGQPCRLWRLGERDTGMQVNAEMFTRTAAILPGVQHAALVQVLTLEQDEEGWFAACAVPEGESLLDTVSKGPLTNSDLSMIALDVMSGLAALEQAGLHHGCPDPDRIRLVRGGPRLTARLDEPGLAPLEHSVRGGAPFGHDVRFSAPELLAGQTGSWQTDCYTAGASLYLAATRQAPVETADATEALTSLATKAVRPVRDLRKDMPPQLASWIMRLMAPHPGDRPADAATALEWLRAALGMRGTGTPPRPMPVVRLRPLPIDPAELPSAPAVPASLEAEPAEQAEPAESPPPAAEPEPVPYTEPAEAQLAAEEPEPPAVLAITDDMFADEEILDPGEPAAEPAAHAEAIPEEESDTWSRHQPVAMPATPAAALPPPPPPPPPVYAMPPRQVPQQHYRPVRQGMGPMAAVLLGLFCAGAGVGGFMLWQQTRKSPPATTEAADSGTEKKAAAPAETGAKPAAAIAAKPAPKNSKAPPPAAAVKENIFVRNFDSSKAPPREFTSGGTLSLRAAPDGWTGADKVLQCHTDSRGGELTMSLPVKDSLNLAEQGLQVFFELGLEPGSQTSLDSIHVSLRTKNSLHAVKLEIALTGGPLVLSAVADGKPIPIKPGGSRGPIGTTAALSPRDPVGFLITLVPAGNDFLVKATSGHASAEILIPPTGGLDRDFSDGSLHLTIPASVSGILADNFTFTALK